MSITITRNGQPVQFEENAEGILVQTSVFKSQAGAPLWGGKSYLLESRIIQASTLGLARQALQAWKAAEAAEAAPARSEAEIMARVTGSRGATIIHQHRDAEGNIVEDSRETWGDVSQHAPAVEPIPGEAQDIRKGDRIAFHPASEPRQVLSAGAVGEQMIIMLDEAGMPTLTKPLDAPVSIYRAADAREARQAAAWEARNAAWAALVAARKAWSQYEGPRLVTGPDGQPAYHPQAQPLVARLQAAEAAMDVERRRTI